MSSIIFRGNKRLATAFLCATSVALLVVVKPASSQTVRPVIAEYQEKTRARFDLVNDSLVLVNVVLEAKSFSLSEDGMPIFRPLDKNIHLKLSTMSFRIPPLQTHYVFYEAFADHYPAWFVIYSTFAGMPKQSGVDVQLELPHTVYLLQKQPLAKSDVQVGTAEYVPATNQIRVELENKGDSFGRVLQVDIAGDHQKETQPGFPLLPHYRRRLEFPWKSDEPPVKLKIRFGKFEIDDPVQEQRN